MTSRVNFEQLEFFLSVVNRKHFTGAAEDSFISQSSLSKQIGRLERELGVLLFERNSRNVRITAAGEAFAGHARRLMEQYRGMQAEMRPYSANAERRAVRLGSSAHIGKVTLVEPVASFMGEHPDITVAIHEGSTGYVLELLAARRLDVAFIAHLISSLDGSSNIDKFDLGGYRLHTVVEDAYFLALNRAHPLANARCADWNDLRGERLILLDRGYSMNRMIRESCAQCGFEASVIAESNQVEAILGMVAAGTGITLMSSRVIRTSASAEVALVEMERPIRRNSVIVYPHRDRMSEHVRTFARYLLRCFGAGGESA